MGSPRTASLAAPSKQRGGIVELLFVDVDEGVACHGACPKVRLARFLADVRCFGVALCRSCVVTAVEESFTAELEQITGRRAQPTLRMIGLWFLQTRMKDGKLLPDSWEHLTFGL